MKMSPNVNLRLTVAQNVINHILFALEVVLEVGVDGEVALDGEGEEFGEVAAWA